MTTFNQQTQKLSNEILILKSNLNLGHHPDNGYKSYYGLEKLHGSLMRLNYLGENTYLSFVNQFEIINYSVKYTVRMSSVTNSSLVVGFCTRKGLSNNSYSHA
jgi:hypothetical protein